MPTNDERREVAARLREKYREKYCPGVWQVQSVNDQIWMYLKDLEACLPDGYSAFNVLADLIEPEERTCHVKLVDVTDSLGQKMYQCSECGALMTDDACFFDGVDEIGWYSYCPNCGAKVVDE